MRNSRGFTLIQLLLAITVLALLAGLSMRAWGSLVVKASAGLARSELASDLALSINRSIGRSDRLLFCPSSDGEACLDSFDWSHGWISFTDPAGIRRLGAGSVLVAAHGPIDGGVRLLSTTGRRSIVFQSGGASLGSNLTFTFCDRRSARALDTLVMSNPGRLHREELKGADAEVANAACQNPPPE